MHPQKFVLIDYENIQPRNLDLLKKHGCRIKIFLSGSQSKLLLDVVKAVQIFGEDAEYIQITGTGPNALDFHIAYYLGTLTLNYPDAEFYVISKDTGFDPLMLHIRHANVSCNRVTSVEQITGEKTPKAKTAASKTPARKKTADVAPPNPNELQLQIEKVRKNLDKRAPTGRPRTFKSLRSTVHALMQKKLTPVQLDALMDELEAKGIISTVGEKLSYAAPTKVEK